MKISVIVASRDRESYLRQLVRDIRAQSLPACEIIVIDQSDNPYGPVVGATVVGDSGRGPCRSRNLGASMALGEILVFIDDDARIEPSFLAELCKPILSGLASASCGSICGPTGEYPSNAHGWRTPTGNWVAALTANPDVPGDSLTMSFPAGCAAIRSTAFRDMGGFDTFFDPNGAGEDREFALRLFAGGYITAYRGGARLWHLAAPAGGRRTESMGRLRLLEANLYYVVCKHFGDQIATEYRAYWRRAILQRTHWWSPRAILRMLLELASMKEFAAHVDGLGMDSTVPTPVNSTQTT